MDKEEINDESNHKIYVKFNAWDCRLCPSIEYLSNWRNEIIFINSEKFNLNMLKFTISPCLNIIKEYIGTKIHLDKCVNRIINRLATELKSDEQSFKYEIAFGDWNGIDYKMLRSSIDSNINLTNILLTTFK